MATKAHPFTPSLLPSACVCGRPKDDLAHGWEEPRAVARRTDPETSWEAAASVTDIRSSQAEVLSLFTRHGSMTDEQAWAAYTGTQSMSGLRTRRSELVAQGLLQDSGIRALGHTGRRMIVWRLPR